MVDVGKVNRLLALVKQEFTRYRSIVRSPSLADPAESIAADCEYRLEELQDRLRSLLARHAAGEDPPVAALSPELWHFYEHDFLPQFEEIKAAHWNSILAELSDGIATPRVAAPKPQPVSRRDGPIGRAIYIGLQATRWRCEENPHWEVEESDFDEAIGVAEHPFFDPDAWRANLRELRPIVTARPSKHFDKPIRDRLGETYRSFVFGNWMAVFALARSLLEYCLRDRARMFGVDPVGSNERAMGLELLEAEFAERLPQIGDAMDLIRHQGNIVMHPSKNRDLGYLPTAVRRDSLAVIDALRLVLSKLYSPR